MSTAFSKSRSSSKPLDPAYQIEASLKSLDQELEDLEASTEAIATKLAALEENCTVIRAHISTLRRVASRLGTSSSTERPPDLLMTGLNSVAIAPGIPPIGHWFEAVEQPTAPAPWPQDPE